MPGPEDSNWQPYFTPFTKEGRVHDEQLCFGSRRQKLPAEG